MGSFIRVDYKKASLSLQQIASKDIPFAMAKGLTLAAKGAMNEIKKDIPEIFNQANAFTRNAVGFTPATKQNQTASIFIKDKQANYLGLEEYGGTRTPQGAKALVVASSSAKRNMSGGLPKSYVKNLAQKAMQDLQKIQKGRRRKGPATAIIKMTGHGPGGKGPGGFFKRDYQKHTQTRLISFVDKATYKPKFGFHQRVESFLKKNMDYYLQKSINSILQGKQ